MAKARKPKINNAYMEDTTWTSEAQKQGYLNYIQYLAISNQEMSPKSLALYLIQKSHESAEWFSKTVGEQISKLEDQIAILQARALESEKRFENFQARLLPVGQIDYVVQPSQSGAQDNNEPGLWIGKKQ